MGNFINNFFTKDEQKAVVFVILVLVLGKLLYAEFTKDKNIVDKRVERRAVYNNKNYHKNHVKILNKISINFGTKEEFVKIPGIGEKTAMGIIKYRVKNGRFVNIKDIKKVKGIGNKKYEKIKKYIKL